MPAPKSRRAQVPVADVLRAASTACLCGAAEKGWAPTAPIRVVCNLQQLQTFWASLKPAARASALKTLGMAELLPQVMDAAELGVDEGYQVAAAFLNNVHLLKGTTDFFEKVLNGDVQLLDGHPPGIRMSDDLIGLACQQVEAGLQERLAGAVPPSHVVTPSKTGLLRFPVTTSTNPEAALALRQCADQGICSPTLDIHYRPWARDTELDMFRSVMECCGLLSGLVIVLQRRLHRAMVRANLVRATMAASAGGSAAAPLPDSCQTWTWGTGEQGQLGLGATKSAITPTPVPAFANQRIIQLSAAGGHALALSAQGVTYGWGHASHGVTGLHDLEPARQPFPCTAGGTDAQGNQRTALQVSTGGLHSVVLQGDRAYSWGCSWLGQLGNTNAMMDAGCLVPFDRTEFKALTNLSPGLLFPDEYYYTLDPHCTPPPHIDVGDGQKRPDPRRVASVASLSGHSAQLGPFYTPDRRAWRPGRPLTGVVGVSAGGLHTLAVTQDGACWTWGCNEGSTLLAAELRHPSGAEFEPSDPYVQSAGCQCCDGKDSMVISISAPVRVNLSSVCQGKAVAVAAGLCISTVLTDQGEVVSWGASNRAPFRVDSAFEGGERGARIASGGPYGVAVTDKTGSVYVWNRTPNAEWGLDAVALEVVHKSKTQADWTPRKVPGLSQVHQVACSNTHCIAATRDGKVYWWPHGAVKLGEGSNSAWLDNYEVVALRGLSVLSVAVGDNFALCATGPPLLIPSAATTVASGQQGEPRQ